MELLQSELKVFDGTVKKEYHQDGYYITDVTVGSTLMQFNLSEKTGSSYTVKNKDNIMNNQAAAAKVVSAEQSSTTRQGVIVKLAFDNKPETDEPLILTAKMKIQGKKQFNWMLTRVRSVIFIMYMQRADWIVRGQIRHRQFSMQTV